VTRGIAIADIDGDGDLDFAVANQWDTSFLYRNDCPHCGAFLGLHLRLPTSGGGAVYDGHPRQPGSAAIGAHATLILPDGRRLVGQVDGGNGHSGKRAPELHFGLPPGVDGPIVVRVDWRDRRGMPRRAEYELEPGWHTVELDTGLLATGEEPSTETAPRIAAKEDSK
jgi:hypothetical protein